ncbi:MAG: hypothetical protein Q8P54_00010 [bacterium]|nr:hypothetical protein [bacterium]
MPLPETWDGVFYGKETNGDMLFDLDPDEFVSTLACHRPDGEFLVAGGVFDLFWNNEKDRAIKLMDLGHTMWPNAPWALIPFIRLTAKNILECGGELDFIEAGINNTIAMLFEGGLVVKTFSATPSST